MFDLLIAGGTVIDGSGAPRRRADVGVRGNRIAAVGDLADAPAPVRIDACDRIVAPGFIDAHTHDDALLLAPPAAHPKLLQGVTTVVTGNCGISLAPLHTDAPPAPLDILGRHAFRHRRFGDYLDALDAQSPATNALCLVGHTTLRAATMADLLRPADAHERAAMRALLAEALAAGAAGLSTGVYYPPARAATADELIDIGAPLRGGRGVLAMHLRDEGDAIEPALDEAFAVAAALAVPLVCSHHKLVGLRNHGRSRDTLARIERAARLQPVCLDCYPYVASSTMLLPERVAGAREVRITWSAPQPAAAGRLLSDLARERGESLEQTARALQPGGAVYFAMAEEDVDRILAHPLTMIGSDGLAHDRAPHPRLWGSFPRVLGHYVRERGLLSLEAAIHKMTTLTAQRFGLTDRGALRAGAMADLVIFDPQRVRDRATYDAPCAPPAGIDAVFVNGVCAARDGVCIDLHAGRVLRAK